ncbi:MAG: polysaccharide deacetylase family protein [Hyphomonas sp.]|nr:polysaccharide deacetylase family protein [Hyphomonas sp.]
MTQLVTPLRRGIITALKGVGLNRQNVAAGRMCCERHLLASLGRSRQRYIGRILCYHSVGQRDWGVNDISPARFRKHIETALNAGFRFVPASEIVRTGGGEKDLAITFDDGLRTVLTTAAPILSEYDVPWTFFPVSEWSECGHEFDEDVVLKWRDVEALMKAGAELGSHSATHPDFSTINPQQVVDELGGSRETFLKRIGVAPDSFAIPFGQSMNWPEIAAKAAADAGYSTIYAQAEETRPEGTVARTFVTKFDDDRIFKAILKGKFDRWEEWV